MRQGLSERPPPPQVLYIEICPNPPPNSGFFIGINGFGDVPDHQQASDARRQGATTEAYGPIRRKEGANAGNAADGALMVDQGFITCLSPMF